MRLCRTRYCERDSGPCTRQEEIVVKPLSGDENDESKGKPKERNRIYFRVGYHRSHCQKSMILWMTIDSHDDKPEEKPEAWRKSFSACRCIFSVCYLPIVIYTTCNYVILAS